MNREQLVQALRAYPRKNRMTFELDKRKGKGSHYRIRVGASVTTVQSDLNPGRIRRILKQLAIKPEDL